MRKEVALFLSLLKVVSTKKRSWKEIKFVLTIYIFPQVWKDFESASTKSPVMDDVPDEVLETIVFDQLCFDNSFIDFLVLDSTSDKFLVKS